MNLEWVEENDILSVLHLHHLNTHWNMKYIGVCVCIYVYIHMTYIKTYIHTHITTYSTIFNDFQDVIYVM